MVHFRKTAMRVAFCVLACALRAAGQASAPEATAEATPMLTLSSPVLRSTMGKVNMAWLVPEQVPDFRLKMERPEWGALTTEDLQGRLRGLEIRLPMEGLWLGYETPVEGEDPRATLSIQRGF
jgi:hypothetical protein